MIARLVLAALLLASAPAAAEQRWATRLRITGVGAVGDDQKYPVYKNVFWIGLSDASWLPEHCRKAPGLLFRDSEAALLQVALAALEKGRTVTVKADDAAMIGDYCTAFQITLYVGQK